MSNDYWEAKEVKEVAEQVVIPRRHPELAEAQIEYIFIDEMKSRGSIVAAKIKKASKMEKYLKDCDLLMTVSATEWNRFNTQRNWSAW